MCGRVDLKPLFLGRLRPERLTSNNIVSGVKALPGGTSSPSIAITLNFTKIYMPVSFYSSLTTVDHILGCRQGLACDDK